MPRWRPSPQTAVAVVFVAAMFMSILDVTIVNVALPSMARDFAVDTGGIEWVVVGYLLSLAMWIPASGWIGDRIGTKRTFLAAVALFTGASVLCGLATSLPVLVARRLLQGAGGGLLTPVGTAMLFRAFPPAERARASRILIIPTATAPASGPIVGGLLVDRLSWRWVFLINLPIGVLAFAWGVLFLTEHREPRDGGFDVAGFVLSGGGLALVLYALGGGPERGWASPGVAGSAVAGLVALAAFVAVELRRRAPLLRLRLLGDRMFRQANVVCLFGYGAFLGLLFVLPLALQEARGLSPLESGLTTFPEAIGVLTMSQLAGRLYPSVGPRRLVAVGLAVLAAVSLAFTRMELDTSLWTIRALLYVAGAGMSLVFIPLQAATFSTITPGDTGHASAIYSTQRQTSAALGVAVLATVLDARLGGDAIGPGSLDAFRTVFLVDAALAVAGVVAALAVHDTDAAPTMRRAPAVALAE